MKESHELKSLQVRKEKITLDINLLMQERTKADKEIYNKKNELKSITEKLNSISNKEPIVTEHAMLRYIERVLNIDLNKITKKTEKNC